MGKKFDELVEQVLGTHDTLGAERYTTEVDCEDKDCPFCALARILRMGTTAEAALGQRRAQLDQLLEVAETEANIAEQQMSHIGRLLNELANARMAATHGKLETIESTPDATKYHSPDHLFAPEGYSPRPPYAAVIRAGNVLIVEESSGYVIVQLWHTEFGMAEHLARVMTAPEAYIDPEPTLDVSSAISALFNQVCQQVGDTLSPQTCRPLTEQLRVVGGQFDKLWANHDSAILDFYLRMRPEIIDDSDTSGKYFARVWFDNKAYIGEGGTERSAVLKLRNALDHQQPVGFV